MKRSFAVAVGVLYCVAVDAAPDYLSCDLPARDGVAPVHFDFTLDEQNSTVSFNVKAANATNEEKAFFGPETITWSNNMAYGSKLSRTIGRTDLSFVQETTIAGIQSRQVGSCSLVTPAKRKF